MINASRTNYYRQRIQDAGSNHRQRWQIVKKLLHSKDTDKTRNDDENRELCYTFARYFVDKIAKLRDSVCDKLRVLSASIPSDVISPL